MINFANVIDFRRKSTDRSPHEQVQYFEGSHCTKNNPCSEHKPVPVCHKDVRGRSSKTRRTDAPPVTEEPPGARRDAEMCAPVAGCQLASLWHYSLCMLFAAEEGCARRGYDGWRGECSRTFREKSLTFLRVCKGCSFRTDAVLRRRVR